MDIQSGLTNQKQGTRTVQKRLNVLVLLCFKDRSGQDATFKYSRLEALSAVIGLLKTGLDGGIE